MHVLSLTMNIFDKSKCKKHSFEALTVVDKPLTFVYALYTLICLIAMLINTECNVCQNCSELPRNLPKSSCLKRQPDYSGHLIIHKPETKQTLVAYDDLIQEHCITAMNSIIIYNINKIAHIHQDTGHVIE